MKKVVFIAVLSVFFAGMSIQAFAVEADFTGEFYVEGILNSSVNMLDSDSTVDYRQMRLRLQTTFMISDNIKLITRFDALDKVLSSHDSAFDNMEDDDNIDFDRAYLSYISPIGLIEVGRMKGITWGTTFCDDEDDTDRIKYTVPIELNNGTLYLGAVAEKVSENDPMRDDDNDKYYLAAVYKTKNYSTGLLSAFYNFNKFQDPGQNFATTDLAASYDTNINVASYRGYLAENVAADNLSSYGAWYSQNATYAMTAQAYQKAALAYQAAGDLAKAAAAASAAAAAAANIDSDWGNDVSASSLLTMKERGTVNDSKVYLLAPYFEGKFGKLSLTGELDYVFGTIKYDEKYNAEDSDVNGYAWFAEAGYDLSPVNVMGGFAFSSGDADYDDNDVECMGYVSPGVDWERLFILNSDKHGMNGTLGNGLGNHVGTGFATPSVAMEDGYQMLYAGVDYSLTDTITLGFIGAISKADAVPDGPGYDDDQGIEYDFSFKWNITDNLSYMAIAAFLDGGDYWSTRGNGGVKDPSIDPDIYALFHRLTLTF